MRGHRQQQQRECRSEHPPSGFVRDLRLEMSLGLGLRKILPVSMFASFGSILLCPLAGEMKNLIFAADGA